MPASTEYTAAEIALSRAFSRERALSLVPVEVAAVKRKAAELAIAIEGLVDRAKKDLGRSKKQVRAALEGHAKAPRFSGERPGALERVRAVADAYKHWDLDMPDHPIRSQLEVLLVGSGYGTDGYGVGKPGDPEVLIQTTDGIRKFLGDAPVAIDAWAQLLAANGSPIPTPVTVCGIEIAV